MKTAWTKGLDDDVAEHIATQFKSSVTIRGRLVELLEDMSDAKRKDQISKGHYESPNWALYQADSVGYVRALQEIISLCK